MTYYTTFYTPDVYPFSETWCAGVDDVEVTVCALL